MKKIFSKIKSIILSEREIICITRNGVKSRKIGALFLVWNILLVFWTSFVTIKYFDMKKEIFLKDIKITELETDKQKLLSNLVIFDKKINTINNFLFSLNKYDRFNDIDENILNKLNNSYSDTSFNEDIKVVLDRIKNNSKNMNLALNNRIKNLSNIKEKIKFNNIQLVSYNENDNLIDKDVIDKDVYDSIVLKNELEKNINKLTKLEEFIDDMPFSEPMQSLYTSSSYGKRVHPFLKDVREHHGIDLVGAYMAKIVAPADGKVIFVGTKGGYGKTIILQHKYGLKTVYAHLSKYKVKKNDIVKRGDIIGIQGSTGRSTGHHLHYEIVRDKTKRYDPMDFMEIGSNFY